jgi:hypothetical protein
VSGQFATKVIASAAIAKIFFKRVSLPRPMEPDGAYARLFGGGLAGSTRRSEKFSEPTPVVKDDQKAELQLMLLLAKSSLAQPAPAQDHKAPDSIITSAARKLIDMRKMRSVASGFSRKIARVCSLPPEGVRDVRSIPPKGRSHVRRNEPEGGGHAQVSAHSKNDDL